MTLSVIILAAGKSTRFKSRRPKVLHELGGKPLLEYSITLAEALTPEKPVLVVGPETDTEIRARFGERVHYVRQTERRGTGHAVMQAQTLLEGQSEQVLVLYGDMPLLRPETLTTLIAGQEESNAALAMLTIEREHSGGFGRVVRDFTGDILRVVEEVEATPEQRAIRELNVGVYVFAADFLWSHLTRLRPSKRKGELYLTDMVGLASESGWRVVGVRAEDLSETLGINTRVDFALAATALRQRINERWMLAGITLLDPATITIEPDVTLGQDTVIYPNTHLLGKTTVGENCEIGPNTVIRDSSVGDDCRVFASVLEGAVMEDESDIGPFGHLRQGARVCRGAHMGNFGEIKNSTLGPGSKMGHFSYLGDAQVGANVNIAAGTITCNYDGERKHRTVIEDGAFIGSDTMLIAPVHIGAGAKIGAGSVVTHDIPPRSVAYGVPARVKRQKENDNEQ